MGLDYEHCESKTCQVKVQVESRDKFPRYPSRICRQVFHAAFMHAG